MMGGVIVIMANTTREETLKRQKPEFFNPTLLTLWSVAFCCGAVLGIAGC